MTSGSLRFHLREHTQAAHVHLDGLIGPLITLERYRCFVSGSYAHRGPVEAWLERASWPDSFGAWRPAMLGSLIAADLDDLDLPRPDIAPFALSNDISSLVGVAYVLEGSALGAKLIWRMAGRLGFDAQHGARHLARQDGSLSNWRGLLAIMDRLEGIDRERAVIAANATFEQAAEAMTGQGFR